MPSKRKIKRRQQTDKEVERNRKLTEQPKSECSSPWEAVDKLEALPEQPKSSSATKENLTPIIEPETKGKNSEVVSQPPEQPNTELLIVKTIQGLMSAAGRELTELNKITSTAKHKVLIDQVLEDITLTERNSLFELQKAFE